MDQLKYDAIVIGGSWGGTEALIQIVSELPASFPIPVIVVLHRQRNVESYLPEILQKYLSLKVEEVEEKEAVKGGKLYLAPANYHVLIEEDRTFSLDASEDVSYSKPSIDTLFESAALVYGKKLIGILLSGANSDGSNGLKTISERQGLTIVQDPEEAEIRAMPLAAISKSKIDHIFKKKDIVQFLLHL